MHEPAQVVRRVPQHDPAAAAATRTIGAHHSPDSDPAMPKALSNESVPGPIAETPVAIAMIMRLYS